MRFEFIIMLLKKNNLIIILAFCVLLIPLFTFAAGWELPKRPDNTPSDFNESLINITNWLLGFVVLIGILMMVWGGISYVGSAGDQEKATTAKRIITYALLGVIIAGLAYAAVNVVVETL